MKKLISLAGLAALTSLASLAPLAGCHPPRSGDTLAESVRTYNEGVRWERFANAAVHVPPKERAQFLDDSDARAKDMRITEYDLVRVEQKNDTEAEVQVKIGWYLDSEGKLRETHSKQTWERHGKTWWIIDESRLRGYEMPGLRETSESSQAAVREAPSQSPDPGSSQQ
jgi:hypothetical protein